MTVSYTWNIQTYAKWLIDQGNEKIILYPQMAGN